MDSENEITEIINEEENVVTEQIQDLEGGHINVIPFHLIKIPKDSSSVQESFTEEYANVSNVVKGKYSKYYRQTYRTAWEQMPDFEGWLKGVKGQPTRAYCTYCQKTLHAHRLSLLKHTCTIRHQKAAQLKGKSNVGKHTNMDNKMHTVFTDNNVIVEEDDSNEMVQSQIIYTQEDIDEAEQDTDNEQNIEEDSDEFGEPASSATQRNSLPKKSEEDVNIPPISTYVVDMTLGTAVSGLSVSLYKLVEGRWTYINEGQTDYTGRFSDFVDRANFSEGRYKLHYDVDRYFETKKQESLFPFIETVFDTAALRRYHFPLLISPNSYTTYRSVHEN